MRTIAAVFFISLFTVSAAFGQPQHVERLPGNILLIEDFEDTAIGAIPDRWYSQKADYEISEASPEVREQYKYRVMEEGGNKFLRHDGIDGLHMNFPIKEVEEIDLRTHPILSWRWRAWNLPEGANENISSKNDNVLSIYVVFDLGHVLFRRVPKSIKYSWSTTLPVGTELSKLFGNQKIVIVESGTSKTGEWITFERNIAEDYRRLFGDSPPKRPLAILIFSDGDNTRSSAVGDYDDIIFKPAE